MVASNARIRITYQIDADGLLSVSAKEMVTGASSSIEVKPSFGLSDSEVSQMLKDSITHATSDVQLRLFQEAIVDATALLSSVEAALIEDMSLLGENELTLINNACMKLRIAINQSTDDYIQHKQKIIGLTQELNSISDEFANRRMDSAIRKALTGKKIEDLTTKDNN
jgi:molecular chaperone HscA